MRSLSLARGYIGKLVHVRIDRPLGSRHPTHGFVYPVNYGYVPGMIAPDGKELDAYVLGIDSPLSTFTGQCIAIVHRFDDDDDKLVLVSRGQRLTDQEIRDQTRFQEQFFDAQVVRS